jgi:hypothetical protein
MKKNQMTGYDETKKMLNTLRKLNESISASKILREQEEPTQSSNLQNDILVINDVEVKLMSSDTVDMKLMDNQKNPLIGNQKGNKAGLFQSLLPQIFY